MEKLLAVIMIGLLILLGIGVTALVVEVVHSNSKEVVKIRSVNKDDIYKYYLEGKAMYFRSNVVTGQITHMVRQDEQTTSTMVPIMVPIR